MTITTDLHPSSSGTPFPLGRRGIHHDPASKDYPAIRGLATTLPIRSVYWTHYGRTLDQLNTNSCTGHTGAHACNARPLHRRRTHLLNHDDALGIYALATTFDPWEGVYHHPTQPGDVDEGSSGLALAKAMQHLGLIDRYEWAFGIEQAKLAIQRGPLMVGTEWTGGMFRPIPGLKGRPTITFDGNVVGGHEYLLDGYDARLDMWRALTSWGDDFGDRGHFWIMGTTLDTMLRRGGDLILPLRNQLTLAA